MKTKPINVLLAATISGLLQAAIAALVAPCFAFLSLLAGAAPSQLQSTVAASDNGMIFALAAPFIFGAIGFLGGGLMAFLFNLLVNTRTERVRVWAVEDAPVQETVAAWGEVA